MRRSVRDTPVPISVFVACSPAAAASCRGMAGTVLGMSARRALQGTAGRLPSSLGIIVARPQSTGMTAAAQQASVYSNACWRRGLAIAAAPSVSKKALRQAQQLKTGGKKVQEALRKQIEDEEARARGEDPALKDKEAEEQSGKGILPSTLKGKPAAEMVRLLQAKGSRKGMGVRLSELHMVLMAVKTPEDGECLGPALSLYLQKNVEFRTETVSHFAKACNRAGRLPWCVACLLDPPKRLGIWAGQTTFHLLLLSLGKEKQGQLALKLYQDLPQRSEGVEVKPRSVHLLVKALLACDMKDEAHAAAQAFTTQGGVLADVTQALLTTDTPAQDAPPADDQGAEAQDKKEA